MISARDNVDSKAARLAKGALEQVCSGARLDCLSQFYSPELVDHVNDFELRGHSGVRTSVKLYRKILSDLAIAVEDQLIDGQRVASKFVVRGTAYGRPVQFNGITISHLQDGLIVEDWSVTDTFGMLRQLGLWRFLLVMLRSLGSQRQTRPTDPRRTVSESGPGH
jgi:predicted ester cyclase